MATPFIDPEFVITPVISGILLVLLMFLAMHPVKKTPTRNSHKPAISALLAIITPTTSVWPDRYHAAAAKAERSRNKTIVLCAYTLLDDIAGGKIQLRHPKKDLAILLQGPIVCHGWTLRLTTGMLPRFLLLKALFYELCQSYIPHSYLRKVAMNDGVSYSDSSPWTNSCTKLLRTQRLPLRQPPNTYSSPRCLPSATSGPKHRHVYALNDVSAYELSSVLSDIKSFLRSKSVVALEFTVCEQGLSALCTTRGVKAIVPMLCYSAGEKKITAPFLTLHRLIGILTTEPRALRVLSVEDVSGNHSEAVDKAAAEIATKGLADAQDERTERERMIMLIWEAATYSDCTYEAPLFRRYIVLVEA